MPWGEKKYKELPFEIYKKTNKNECNEALAIMILGVPFLWFWFGHDFGLKERTWRLKMVAWIVRNEKSSALAQDTF